MSPDTHADDAREGIPGSTHNSTKVDGVVSLKFGTLDPPPAETGLSATVVDSKRGILKSAIREVDDKSTSVALVW